MSKKKARKKTKKKSLRLKYIQNHVETNRSQQKSIVFDLFYYNNHEIRKLNTQKGSSSLKKGQMKVYHKQNKKSIIFGVYSFQHYYLLV